MHDRSRAWFSMHHGAPPHGHAVTFDMEDVGRPLLDVGTGSGLGWSLSTTGEITEGHVQFARQVATAAADYAERVEFYAGAQAGAAFWASIDTCPDSCGPDCRGPH